MKGGVDMFPIFALVCLSTESVEYTSEQYSKVSALYRSIPPSIRDYFSVVRYYPDPNYTHNEKEQ